MNEFAQDRENVNYELPVLSGLNQAQLQQTLENPRTRWFGLKRLARFDRMGLLAAGAWNPLLHPRGPDGKFITKFGFVRALINHKWERGYVSAIDTDGTVTVNFKSHGTTRKYSNYEASKSLYAAPKAKARLDLPELGKKTAKWEMTGSQAGSNAGGKFQLNMDSASVDGSVSSAAVAHALLGDGAAAIKEAGGEGWFVVPFRDEKSLQLIKDKLPSVGIAVVAGDHGRSVVYKVTVSEDGDQLIQNVVTGEKVQVGPDFPLPIPENTSLFFMPWANEAQMNAGIDARIALIQATSPSTISTGEEVYVKKSKSLNHARNEVLANRFYELAGVPGPDVHFGEDPQYVGSKILTGEIKPLSSAFGDEELMSQIRENLVVDAWLANWDVAGLTYDNIVIVDGVPTRIDAGGSLLFRAQGGPKGKFFGGKVTELSTLRDKSMNPQSAKVFGSTTPEELQAGAERVAAIHPDTIRAYVEDVGMDSDLANVLIARRADIIETILAGKDPYAPGASPDINASPTDVAYSSYTDAVLLDTAKSLINHGVEDKADALFAEIEARGLGDELQAAKIEADDLISQGVSPKYPTVLPAPEDAAESLSASDLVLQKGDDGKPDGWVWDTEGKTWYRGSTQGSVITDMRDEVDSYVKSLPPFVDGGDEVTPVPFDSLFEPSSSEVRADMIGKWFFLGGHVFEVQGKGTPLAGFRTVRMRDISSGQVVDLPEETIYSSHKNPLEDISTWSKGEGLTDGLTLGYVLDPGETRLAGEALLKQWYTIELNHQMSTFLPSDSHTFLSNLRANSAPSTRYGQNKSYKKVTLETRVFGIDFAPPPSNMANVDLTYTDYIEIPRPVIGATAPLTQKQLLELEPGRMFMLGSGGIRAIFQIEADGKVRFLHAQKGAKPAEYVDGVDVLNEGDIFDLSALNGGSAVLSVSTKPTSDAFNALRERERIFAEAQADLSAALDVAILSEQSTLLTTDDLMTLGDDAPVPASVQIFADYFSSKRNTSLKPTEPKPFNPTASGLKYLGAVQKEQLVEGTWITSPFGESWLTPYRVEEIIKNEDGSVKHISATSITGSRRIINFYESDTVLRVAPPGVPTSAPQFKKNGELVVDGIVVGSWKTDDYGERDVTLFAHANARGADVRLNGKLSQVRDELKSIVVVPTEHATAVAEKSAKAKKAASEIKWKVGKLGDGTEVQSGLPVRSLVTGNDGVLVGSIHPSSSTYVYVKFEDGNIEVMESAAVISLGKPTAPDVKPSTEKATPSPKPAVIVPKDLPAAVQEAIAAQPANFVMADGSAPAPGMVVSAGKGKKNITGKVLLINKDGYMHVQDADGKKHWRSIKVATVLEAPSFADDPAVGISVAAIALAPDVPAAVPTPSPGDVPQSPDFELAGVSILQSQDRIDKHLGLGGNLTFDGFIPDTGLPVFDRQGNQLIIVRVRKNAKDSVEVYDPADPGKLKSRKISSLTVDLSSYAGTEGSISDMNLVLHGAVAHLPSGVPAGSSIYEVGTSDIGSTRTKNYIAIVSPDGRVWQSQSKWDYTSGHYIPKWMQHGSDPVGFYQASYAHGEIKKVGVYNPGEGNGILYSPYANASGVITPSHMAVVPKIDDSINVVDEMAKSKVAEAPAVLDELGAVVDGVPAPDSFTASSSFPEPPGAPKRSTTGAPVPAVTGVGAELTKTPPSLSGSKVQSVHDAARKVISKKTTSEVGSGVAYATMDEDYIEDTTVSFQVVRDHTGVEFVEMRFRLQEERSEAVADTLLSAGNAEYGNWTQDTTVHPTDLLEGDFIQVYKSKSTGALKPIEESSSANARVTGPATLIGRSDKSNFDVYRVPVVLADGEVSVVDIELRESGSVGTLKWDPDVVNYTSSMSTFGVSGTGKDAGWESRSDSVQTLHAGSQNVHAHVDEMGVAKLSADGENKGYGSKISSPGGNVLYRTLDDGTVIRFNAVASSASGTGQGDVRRAEMARDVRVRVPLDSPDLDLALSRGLEAVGVPPEKQGPPSEEALARLALNKAYKHFSPTFVHRKQLSINSVSADDPEVAKLLDTMSSRIGLVGEDRVTLDDIEIGVAPDGRIVPRLSKRVAQAVSAKQGNKYYRHGLTGDRVQNVLNIFGGFTVTGLLGADERHSFGITTRGQSTSEDMRSGAGDRVYITGMASSHISGSVIMSADTINTTLEGYVNGGDKWGKRKAKNDFVKHGDAYEYMIKRKLEAEQIAYVIVDKKSRQEILEKLKARGVTMVGSRKIEDIIVTDVPQNVGADFQLLGSDALEIAGTVGGMAQSAGATGGVV